MRRLADLLDGLDLPALGSAEPVDYALPGAALLGADLPAGHVHVWCGPPGAGKTALLLGLLHDAARHGRPSVLATYDLAAPSVALRLLAMASGVAVHDLETRALSPAAAAAVAGARARLCALPIHVLEARGLCVDSLDDRIVRSPVRFEVLGIDVLEAVARPCGRTAGQVLEDLSDLARARWLAVVCASKAVPVDPRSATPSEPGWRADRVGVLEPAPLGAVEAAVLANRHGPRVARRLSVDAAAARLVDR